VTLDNDTDMGDAAPPSEEPTTERRPPEFPPPSAVVMKIEMFGVTVWTPDMTEEERAKAMQEAVARNPEAQRFRELLAKHESATAGPSGSTDALGSPPSTPSTAKR